MPNYAQAGFDLVPMWYLWWAMLDFRLVAGTSFYKTQALEISPESPRLKKFGRAIKARFW